MTHPGVVPHSVAAVLNFWAAQYHGASCTGRFGASLEPYAAGCDVAPIDEDPHFADFDDLFSIFYVDFDDGMQLAFHPHQRFVRPPRLTHLQLRFGATGQEFARYNLHGTEGGGMFTLVSGEEYRHELGGHWVLAYKLLQPRPFDSPRRQRAWSYLSGSLVYAERLQKPARTGLL